MWLRDSIHDMTLCERLSNNMYLDNNGQLICEGVVLARTGDYQYREDELIPDGSSEKVVTVHRSPEEVFDPVSMKSMNYKPFVDEHPEDNITPDTVGELQKGFMTNVRKGSGEFEGCLMADLVVTDPYVIDLIRSGKKRELSVGYTADIVEDGKGGYEMKNIRGNHIALCEAGRAGNARIRDSRKALESTVKDFEAKGSFNSIEELVSFYKGSTTEAKDGGLLVRLANGDKLLYSFVGDGKLAFIRRVKDSVQVLGDAVKLREGQRVNYLGENYVIKEIYPSGYRFMITLAHGSGLDVRLGYDDFVVNVNQGKIKLLDSVVFDRESGEFKLVEEESYADCFKDKAVLDAKEAYAIYFGSGTPYVCFANSELSARRWAEKSEGDTATKVVLLRKGSNDYYYYVGNDPKEVPVVDSKLDDPAHEKELDRTHFIDTYLRGDKVKPREGGSVEEIIDIITESTGAAGSGRITKKYVMKSGRKYTAEDLEGSAWIKVSDSLSNADLAALANRCLSAKTTGELFSVAGVVSYSDKELSEKIKNAINSNRMYGFENRKNACANVLTMAIKGRDSGESLKSFRVVRDGRSFVTRATSAADAVRKVGDAMRKPFIARSESEARDYAMKLMQRDPNKFIDYEREIASIDGVSLSSYLEGKTIGNRVAALFEEGFLDKNYEFWDSFNDELVKSSSKEAFEKNIATEIEAGKDPKQAAAIAYSVQRKNRG